MISSMTAFSNVKTEFEHGTLQVELRCVNNRYLDLSLRIPEDFRAIEDKLRELISGSVQRGKLELKIVFKEQQDVNRFEVDEMAINQLREAIASLRANFPEMPTPTMPEILQMAQELQAISQQKDEDESAQSTFWQTVHEHSLTTVATALAEFIAMRQREGERLATTMREYSQGILQYVEELESRQPILLQEQTDKINQRLTEALEAIAPNGFEYISGEELSMRIAQESALFGMRVDIAEEITRLKSHATELAQLLSGQTNSTNSKGKNKQSLGRRLDFLFQEMNREINTIGSKSASLDNTQAVIEMKLLVEQLREQALNIE